MDYELYIFGSLLSGEVDAGSDVDVLAIVKGDVTKGAFPSNWSAYSADRISQLYQRGTLFAWHLHLESMLIYPRQDKHTLLTLGKPKEYTDAAAEIATLRNIAEQALYELQHNSPSVAFEYGLLFLSARDIAMAASHKLTGKFDFSRYAPLHLAAAPFPFNLSEYQFLMGCRRASTRGQAPEWNSSIEQSICGKSQRFLNWCEKIYAEVSK